MAMRALRLGESWGEHEGKTFQFPEGTPKKIRKASIIKQLGLPPDWAPKGYVKPTKFDVAKRAVTETAGKTGEFLGGLGQQFYGGQREMMSDTSRLLGVQPAAYEPTPEAQGIPQKAARIVGGLSAPIGGVPGGGIVPGAIKGIMRTSRAYPALKKITGSIGKIAKQAIPFGMETLSSVPRERVSRAMSKGFIKEAPTDKEFQKVGNMAQKAINKLNKDAGMSVKKEDLLLSKLQEKIGKNIGFIKSRDISGKSIHVSPKEYTQKIDQLFSPLKRSRAGLLKPKDNKMISRIKNMLGKDPAIVDIQDFKKEIDDFVSYSTEGVRQASPRGQSLFKEISNDFRETIAKVSPNLAKANEKSHAMQKLRDELRTELKNKAIGKKLKNFESQNTYTQELFEKLDQAAPSQYKFLEKTQRLLDRKAFEPWFPGRGGGSGSPQGAANILRGITGLSAKPLIPLMSPKINEALIRGGRRALRPRDPFRPRPIRSLMKRGAVRTGIRGMAPSKNPDGTFTDSFKRGLITDDPRRNL